MQAVRTAKTGPRGAANSAAHVPCDAPPDGYSIGTVKTGNEKTTGADERFAAIEADFEVVPGNVVGNAAADPCEPELNGTPKPPRRPRLGGGLQARGCEKMGPYRTLPMQALTNQCLSTARSGLEAVKKCWGQSTAASARVDSRELKEGLL